MNSTDDDLEIMEIEKLDDEMQDKERSEKDDNKATDSSDSEDDDDIEIEITKIDYRKKIDSRELVKKGCIKKFKNLLNICIDDHMAPFRPLLWEMKDKSEIEKKNKIGGLLKGQARKVLMTVTGKNQTKIKQTS